MANTTSKGKKTTKPASEVTEVKEQVEKKEYKVRTELDPSMYVTVKNGFNGTLVYKSKKTGERFIWDAFGDEQDIELAELKSARNSYKPFFINNWFLFDDPEVIEWLGMGQYYKHALNSENFDKIFKKSPEEIKQFVEENEIGMVIFDDDHEESVPYICHYLGAVVCILYQGSGYYAFE